MKKSAFTLIELMIVIAIMLILAAAAMSGMSSVLRNLRFGNAFNKAVFMVQQARNLAATEKGAAASYRVEIASDNIKLFADTTLTETYNLQNMPGATFVSQVTGITGNCSTAKIEFAKGAAKTILTCEGGSANPASLTVALSDTANSLNKSFSIHNAAGIPQL
ncbi:prepilin-type N-terminal cleavage/methylation domain-containing protein [Candidatus Peregrinibacteria bacterium]|nr:prepilin-type N-terminal cleavage/methylation domain-containing protein [Candidatus Peregrinibacteria bacterium]